MKSSARPWLIFALALAAGVGVAPSAARASCGDYVRVGDTPPAPPQPESTRPAAPPCSGPGCSRDEAPPPAPAPPAPAREWACPVPPELLDPDGESAFGSSRDELPVSGLPLSVYHPPRRLP